MKAVSGSINPDTPGHFRHEIEVLSELPPAPYRARMLSTYDDGDWVAIALENIDGDHPDWSSQRDRDAVEAAVLAQSAELTPAPTGVTTLSSRRALLTYLAAMASPTDGELAGLPRWAAERLDELRALTHATVDHQRDESLCHYDIRHDNIVIRAVDGQPVLVDWGMSRLGQHWCDLMVFALEWVAEPRFDEILARGGLTADEERDVTGFLAGIGCYLAMAATHPAPPGLPTLPEFRRQLGAACLAGVARRT